ncbi:MAG: hypothetical protein NVSMB6_17250 [Burkholderiaceae bacterium]
MAIRDVGLDFGLRRLERGARLVAGGVAIVAVLVGISFRTGLVSTAAVYERQSWYVVSEQRNFLLTREVNDEAACREKVYVGAVCRSGASLMDQAAAVGRH